MNQITIFDVAKYILKKQGSMSAMKLQKLAYYSQAWSLVWDESALFANRIEAWANGPVIPDLYELHKGMYQVDFDVVDGKGETQLTEAQKETIDLVLEAYGKKSAQWLSDQTHSEPPWQGAREGLSDSERSSREITLASMAEYYEKL